MALRGRPPRRGQLAAQARREARCACRAALAGRLLLLLAGAAAALSTQRRAGRAFLPPPAAAPRALGPRACTEACAGAAAVAAAWAPAAQAASTKIEDAAVRFAEVSYPIVQSLSAKDLAPVAGKAVSAAFTGDLTKVGKAADAVVQVLMACDSPKVVAVLKSVDVALQAALKDGGLLPPLEEVKEVSRAVADALQSTEKAKLRALLDTFVAAGLSGNPLDILGVFSDPSIAKLSFFKDVLAAGGELGNLLSAATV